MPLYKNCGWWKNCDCMFGFSVKSYVRNTINLSWDKILLTNIIYLTNLNVIFFKYLNGKKCLNTFRMAQYLFFCWDSRFREEANGKACRTQSRGYKFVHRCSQKMN
jgi:hypothetical protein